jgi:CheY-like chemotaxis protein
MFTQAERSLDRSQGGLGIGLALVQRLVEMHAGRVEVISELGKGSEFVVRLPAALSSEPPVLAPSIGSAKPAATALRVLVVDDNADTAETLASLLREVGHDVRIGYDGPSALEVALSFLPNVVLLDIGLPGLSGYEVAKRLRQQSVLRNVVLIAVTGYSQDSDRRSSLEAGFDHHLIKPANFDKVQQILAMVAEKAT